MNIMEYNKIFSLKSTMKTSAVTGLVGSGAGLVIARKLAKKKALEMGLTPGTPEYKKFIAKKMAIGAATGTGIGIASGVGGSMIYNLHSGKNKGTNKDIKELNKRMQLRLRKNNLTNSDEAHLMDLDKKLAIKEKIRLHRALKNTFHSDVRGFSFASKLSLAATGVSLVGGAVGLAKSLNSKTKFIVVYRTANGRGKQNISAENMIDAKNQAMKRMPNATNVRVFPSPEQDSEALEYYDSLN